MNVNVEESSQNRVTHSLIGFVINAERNNSMAGISKTKYTAQAIENMSFFIA